MIFSVSLDWLTGGGVLVIFIVGVLIFSWWWLGRIDEMEQAAEDYLFSEMDAVSKRLRSRAQKRRD